MNEELKSSDLRVHDDGKPETTPTPGSQTERTPTESDCEEVQELTIPIARFWGLCVG
jgi:hypothetical protein